MQIAKLTDVRLHWREDGNPEGAPVVFSNSLGTDLRLWDKVIPLLPQNLRLIRYDKRGHGLSSCPEAPYSVGDLTRDAEQFLDQLNVRDCVFVGLSIGGVIAQSLAARRPDLTKALVLSNSAARMGDSAMWQDRIATLRKGGLEALAEPIMQRWFSAGFRGRDELTAWRNMLTRTPQEGYLGCCHALADTDLTDQTAKLKLPALGIAGSEDGACAPATVKATVDLIPGSSFETLAGVGHLPCVEAPEHYADLLTAFLRKVGHV